MNYGLILFEDLCVISVIIRSHGQVLGYHWGHCGNIFMHKISILFCFCSLTEHMTWKSASPQCLTSSSKRRALRKGLERQVRWLYLLSLPIYTHWAHHVTDTHHSHQLSLEVCSDWCYIHDMREHWSRGRKWQRWCVKERELWISHFYALIYSFSSLDSVIDS